MVDPLGAQLVAELHKRVDAEMGGHRVGRLSRRLVTDAAGPVSYTHLDVYKRQLIH